MIRELFPCDTAKDVFSIDYRRLYEMGYRGLLFDIDNTLVHHGDDSTPEVDELFRKIHQIGFKTLLLSNNDEERVQRFNKNIHTDYICDADKPSPESYREACRRMNIALSEAVMIGDQLFTDVRGASRCGMDSILVHYIGVPGELWLGWHRYAEYLLLFVFHLCRPFFPRLGPKSGSPKNNIISGENTMSRIGKYLRKEILFCEISPAAYQISLGKEIARKKLHDMRHRENYAKERKKEVLPFIAAESRASMIKRAPGVDLTMQENKAVNIDIACRTFNHLVIHPGESFSFWKYVGKTTAEKGYLNGRIIRDGKLVPGVGGGLCNLANTLHLLVRQTPLTVTELHTHSDALAPDEGPRKPFANGTSVSYSNIDFRFANNTDQDFQIVIGTRGEMLCAQLRCEHPYPYTYRLAEEGHHFQKEGDKYYRVSKIYHETYDKETGELLKRELILDNHSQVMYAPDLIVGEITE